MVVNLASQEHFPHGRWLLCQPVDYDVRYKINPWMDPKRTPEKMQARQQWQNLHHHLLRLGAWVEYVTHADGWPDMVFTANAGLVRGLDVVLSRFRHPERQGEEPFYRAWFESNGFNVLTVSAGSFEGEGDALFIGDTLVCGYGFRTDKETHAEVAGLLHVARYLSVELVDPYFYHLDTCFCPLNESLALIYPGAFRQEDVARLEQEITLLRVSEADARHFVCNAVVLGNDVVLPAGCDETYQILAANGFRSYPIELSEFIKAGGAAKCLSLKLSQ
jgi:N-dimethylarginine dimethylaminohydrolase